MKKLVLLTLVTAALGLNSYAQSKGHFSEKGSIAIDYLNNSFPVYDQLQKNIWGKAELGFIEKESSILLQQQLQKNGFKVEAGVAGMPTAFVASYGSGSPVIGILAEFDALPGLSQDTVPYKKPLIEGGNGHGCGHNVFGVGSVAGAIAIKQWLEQTKHPGTIKVFGSPAEEGGGGKVYLVREGSFKGVDLVLDWHPAAGNGVSTDTGTAIQMIDYSFYGKAAHAAGSPDKGRSALDAVEAFDYLVNMMREHVPTSSRIHYIIANGGEAPNVVPAYARVSYYIRSPKRDALKDLTTWINQAAQGAALGTQTTVKSEIISGFYERLYNKTLANLVQKKLEKVGGVIYNPREETFAKEIVKGLGELDTVLLKVQRVESLKEEKVSQGGGSSDVGDVSWTVPTVSFGTAAFIPGSAGHSWQNVASGGSTIGTKALINAAKVFSLSAIELYTDPKLVEKAKQEFNTRRGSDFHYEPLLGNRAPALDYRVKK
ncbi:amidohydrolase [uncultured Bacteroides sp.]|uniref:amidohydrolase n=1 Tax=uncultured Bacteroides sp. TaxID=162156 RepID=UPI002AAAA7F7|nr:amidohydrolase [uncultured Bacteroides sp.]